MVSYLLHIRIPWTWSKRISAKPGLGVSTGESEGNTVRVAKGTHIHTRFTSSAAAVPSLSHIWLLQV